MPTYISLVLCDIRRTTNNDLEGPTAAQALKMAAYRQRLLASARTALAAGDDDRAFDRDCEAMDVEGDLITFGFNPDTGRRR